MLEIPAVNDGVADPDAGVNINNAVALLNAGDEPIGVPIPAPVAIEAAPILNAAPMLELPAVNDGVADPDAAAMLEIPVVNDGVAVPHVGAAHQPPAHIPDPPVNELAAPAAVRCSKHIKHKSACPNTCIFRLYFPANMSEEFDLVNEIFGSQCVEKLLKRAPTPEQRAQVPAAIIDDARAWAADPARGTFGEAEHLREELAILLQQLEALQQQLGAANEPFVPVPVPVLIEAAPVNAAHVPGPFVIAPAAPAAVRCAKHIKQKSACPNNCLFRPYFPANMLAEFELVNEVFGSQCIDKLLRRALTPAERAQVPAAIVDAARAWTADPARGTFGEAEQLREVIEMRRQQLEALQIQVALQGQQE